MNIIIEHPQEFNPVELIRLVQAQTSLTYREIAIAFSCEPNTIAKWMCGAKKPSKAYRIWAGELKKKWNL